MVKQTSTRDGGAGTTIFLIFSHFRFILGTHFTLRVSWEIVFQTERDARVVCFWVNNFVEVDEQKKKRKLRNICKGKIILCYSF